MSFNAAQSDREETIMIEVTCITIAVLAFDFAFVLLVGKFIHVGMGD